VSSEFFSVAGAIRSAEERLAEYSEKDNENFDVRMHRVNSRIISVFLITETDLKYAKQSQRNLEEAREVSLIIDKFNMAQVDPKSPNLVTVPVSRRNIDKIAEILIKAEETMMARSLAEDAVLELESGFVAAGGERNNWILEMLEIRRKQR